ncbi:hypothetical protein SCHPADRAFT_548479 [Schizopora paradoxa]|uniref:Secreted protein n=1 Tax=Schizopora paradoxa TaxID=27342 RepID=A0A0H2RDC5_9AGAM|nr:hypothetical protein SCHPADRAFT_548479 [Schizopora paradoxa]
MHASRFAVFFAFLVRTVRIASFFDSRGEQAPEELGRVEGAIGNRAWIGELMMSAWDEVSYLIPKRYVTIRCLKVLNDRHFEFWFYIEKYNARRFERCKRPSSCRRRVGAST